MLVAITRPTGPELAECELTHLERMPIDIEKAIAQHSAYVDLLASLGVGVVELDRLPQHPDAVFVEDTALVLDEVAIMLRPGATSRLGELESVAHRVADYRDLAWLEGPGTVDGGDVVVLGNDVLVGITSRTDPAGVAGLQGLLTGFGYRVSTVLVDGCLHLKTAATAADDETIVAYAPWVGLDGLSWDVIEVPSDEPQGANVVRVGESLLVEASATGTIELLRARGYEVHPLDVSEFGKAEGALTCKSLIFEAEPGGVPTARGSL